ncbi:urease accessory protein [Rhodococcoides trifolii]|uniref:Urease accessory protein n=1 Tax=Rhodococcoides trifolii TaxID=908250 RepID=A0A917FW63_9NOCA|nr:urease accessory protein [Rhodococcus trifolii]
MHLIGTAQTPLGGDEICVDVRVEAGARLVLRSVAATVALPSRETDLSSASWTFDVADGASLVFDPQPTIVASTADHRTVTRVVMARSASVVVRERVRIGRSNESAGRWSGALNVDVEGRPRLRHRLELGRGAAGHDVLFAPSALVSTLHIGDDEADTVTVDGHRLDRTTVRLPLAGGGSLCTWLGGELPSS